MSKPKGSVKLTRILFASTNCRSRREERSIEKWRKKHTSKCQRTKQHKKTHTRREREKEGGGRQREATRRYDGRQPVIERPGLSRYVGLDDDSGAYLVKQAFFFFKGKEKPKNTIRQKLMMGLVNAPKNGFLFLSTPLV